MNEVNPYEPPREVSPVAAPGRLPVRVTGVLTADDAIATLKSMGRWRPWLAAVIVIPLLIVVAALFTAHHGIRNLWAPVMAVGTLMVVLVWMTFGAKRRMEKQWNAMPDHLQPISWTFSEDGLFVETVNSKHLHSWNAFAHASITPDILILAQHGDAMWNFIPRRLFETDADWQAVAQLIGKKIRVCQASGR